MRFNSRTSKEQNVGSTETASYDVGALLMADE